MSLDYPTFDELVEQIRAEFRVQLPDVDPTIFGSWARAFADGNAVLAQTLTFLIRDLEQQLFPQTATGEFLDLWGGYEGLERLAATGATGYASLPGTLGVTIPALTEFTGSNGEIYETQTVASIVNVVQSISSLTRSGSTVTATTPAYHNLATGIEITVAGASETEYNGDTIITVTGTNTFQYTISGSPSSPATGTIEYDIDMAVLALDAQNTGSYTDLDSGAQLSNDTYGTAIAQYGGLAGGSSEESDDDYRTRILLSRASIAGVFTPDQVKLAALSISGNTRAFVKKPTLSVTGGTADDPLPGQVSVYILRDNDSNIIPSQAILDETKEAIIADGALPSHTAEIDLFVEAPTLVETDFTFSAISPDTPTMQAAITDQLQAYFEDSVDFEDTVTEASYLGAIQNTQDLETGDYLVSFALSAPTGDITVSDGEIASLGDVTFA